MNAALNSGQLPQHTPEFLKERKFLVIMPLLIIPFLTMAFWALGGGKQSASAFENSDAQGLNATLPQAQFKDQKARDKMGVYQTVKTDSASSDNSGVSESFVKSMGLDAAKAAHTDSTTERSTVNLTGTSTADVNEAKIQAKLAAINHQINQTEPVDNEKISTTQRSNADVKRLNKMMKTMNGGHSDPEMQQIAGMLDRLQAIQNPGSVKPKAVKISEKPFRAIPAVIDGKQKVMDGAPVRLKFADSIRLKGQFLGKGQLLFGICQVTNQRLLLSISNIRKGNDIIPVDLTVFSQDGMPGIPAPEAELSGSAGIGADQAIQSMQILSMDQSIGAQAAAGGVNAAKNLFSKKIKKIKVKLKDGFPVLLKINR